LEPEDRPDEFELPASARGLLVADGDEEVELAPGEGDPAAGESDDDAEEEEESDEAEDDEEAEEVGDVDDVEVAKFHPLSCTPTTCVAPNVVLVSDQGPSSVTVK
jgi:hypothetical protein